MPVAVYWAHEVRTSEGCAVMEAVLLEHGYIYSAAGWR